MALGVRLGSGEPTNLRSMSPQNFDCVECVDFVEKAGTRGAARPRERVDAVDEIDRIDKIGCARGPNIAAAGTIW